jgi:hypothetical protein
MNEKPRHRGRRQISCRCAAYHTTTTRCGVLATFIALLLIIVNSSSAIGAPSLVFLTGAGVGAGDGSEALLVPLRQPTSSIADSDTSTNSGATSEASRMATIVAVVNQQGIQGPVNLRRVSGVAVSNLMTMPALVVDARAKRAAEADAAAAEIALMVQATVEAQEAEAASKAAALAASEQAEADAAASATAAAIATETARASAAEAAAMLSAKQETRVRAAELAATRNVEPVAAPVVSASTSPDRMSSLLIALTPMLGGVLGLRIWRSRKEPFVLKANLTSAHSSAAV